MFFPAIYVANFFKFVLFGQRHFIESVFYLTHGVRTRLNCVMHLLRRTLSHRSQSRFDGFVSLTVVHHFPRTPSAHNEQPVISPAPIHLFFLSEPSSLDTPLGFRA